MSELSKTDPFIEIFEVVKLIPPGRVTTYGAIARYLGINGARQVGWAMNASHTYVGVPAHRVVNRLGVLTGKHHFGSPTAMQEQLEAEGVAVMQDTVQNFEQVFWDPTRNLL